MARQAKRIPRDASTYRGARRNDARWKRASLLREHRRKGGSISDWMRLIKDKPYLIDELRREREDRIAAAMNQGDA